MFRYDPPPSWLAGLLLGMLLVGGVRAQQADPRAAGTVLPFDHLTTADGLSQRIVYDILEDREGYLWFATRDGLNRFDGHRFKVYRHIPGDPTTLSDSKVIALFEDRDGILWVGTMEGGLNRFDRRTETFSHFRHDPQDPYSLPDDRVRAIVQDRAGALWIGTYQSGLTRFDPAAGRFTGYGQTLVDTARSGQIRIASLLYDGRGRLWVGSYDYDYLCRFDLTRGTCAGRYLDGYATNALLADAGDTLWAVAATVPLNVAQPYWLIRLHAGTGEILNRTPLPMGDARDIVRGRDGTIWISSSSGLLAFDPRRRTFAQYRHDPRDPTSLLHNDVWSLWQDRSGALWVGSGEGISVHRPDERSFRLYRGAPDQPNSLSHNHVNALLETRDGLLWAGTTHGLNRIDRASGTVTRIVRAPIPTADAIYINRIWSLFEDRRGTLWIGTGRSGLHRYDPKSGAFTHEYGLHRAMTKAHPHSLYQFPRDNQAVTHFLEDRDGYLWLGTRNGAARRDPATGAYVVYHHDPEVPYSLSHNYVNVIYEDAAGHLWIGTDYGLNRFDRATGRFTRYVHDPQNPLTLNANIIWTLAESPAAPGVLWVGTVGGGLNRFDPRTGSFRALTTAHGLPNDNIYGMLSDDRGNLWMSTGHGIARFDPRMETFTNYDAGDGLQDDEFHMLAYHRSRRTGELFFGGPNGFNSFYPDSIRTSDYEPPVVLTGFRIFDEEHPGMLSSGDTLALSYRENFFTLSFAALDYVNPAHNQYRYRLEGFDVQWRATDGSRPEAAYTSVPPGRYRFVVEGTNHDGVVSLRQAHLHVVIVPPFWARIWFRLLVAVAVLALLAVLYRYRVYHLLQVERTRIRIADDLHDDIGSKVSTIALMADLGRRSARIEEAHQYLYAVSERTREVAQDLRDTVWVIDAGEDTLPALVARMQQSARQMLQGMHYTIVVPERVADLPLPMDLRRGVLLIFKEALHNTVRHAQATHVHVAVAWEDGVLSFDVHDDGRGFESASKGDGRGQKTMRARAAALGGRLTIESRVGEGTVVRVRIPLGRSRGHAGADSKSALRFSS